MTLQYWKIFKVNNGREISFPAVGLLRHNNSLVTVSSSDDDVCDDDATFTWTQKIEKSELKCPGEDGSIGAGEKGTEGNSCVLGALGTEIVTRLSKIEEIIRSPEIKTISPPHDTTTSGTTTITTATMRTRPQTTSSCVDAPGSGVYVLTSGVKVYCEDGWTVFQRRINGNVDFQRGWDDYANGFGQIDGKFWLGLDNIHEMTRGGGCRLKIELWDFNGTQAHADHSSFSIESAGNVYRLHVSGYTGAAGYAVGWHNGAPFSTWDRNNDGSSLNCASRFGGNQGWWFKNCLACALNGVWMRESTGHAHGIVWGSWKSYAEPLKATKMKFRCD
ncbi:unnamed protein product [Clavelina lepadiformis]|uniref:Fibrinogen C-terminal domain-containing protein n=1 Tax=Clavelina lepadiformis TaxID=159417 RepID=A0ABP0G4P3_CLALP